MFEAIRFTKGMEQEWDDFVLNQSVNGTFLQTRNFLNYHPPGRFQDCSIMLKDIDHNIYGVIPGCVMEEKGGKTFFSHKGSTFGGLVPNTKYYNASRIQQMLEIFEEYLRQEGFQRVYLKVTPTLFSTQSSDLLEYMFHFNGYSSYRELSTYIDYPHYNQDITANFNANKRKLIRKMSGIGLVFRELHTDEECAGFYVLLCANLAKYNVSPIHTLEEILDFKNHRLIKNVRFYGVFYAERLLAAGMMFDFPEIKVVHAQNLSTDPNNMEIDAITYLYYSLIVHYRNQGYQSLSWGISTENHGIDLNFSLLKNKESYGSSYSINRTFYKDLYQMDSGVVKTDR